MIKTGPNGFGPDGRHVRMPDSDCDALRQLFNLSNDVLSVSTIDGRFVMISPSLSRLTGYSEEELRSRPFLEFAHPDDRERAIAEMSEHAKGEMTISYEGRTIAADGRVRWLRWTGTPDLERGLVYSVAHDVTEQHEAREKLSRYAESLEHTQQELKTALAEVRRLAGTDQLTGLMNRAAFEERAADELNRARRDGKHVSVALLDIDLFKRVNDGYGHPTGDFVLREVARRIASASREYDLVARWGGEEFVVFFPDTRTDAARVATERIALALSTRPVSAGSQLMPMTLSAGVAGGLATEIPHIDRLVDAADRALLRAKHDGRDRVEVEPSLQPDASSSAA